MNGKPVTITISKENHYSNREMFKEGMFINLGKNSWNLHFTRQKIKNRRMIGRLLKIEFIPKLIVEKIEGIQYGHTLTVKPYNF